MPLCWNGKMLENAIDKHYKFIYPIKKNSKSSYVHV